jgi:hypothetical protein
MIGNVMHDPRELSSQPRFEPGSKVRVKYGVTDPDFPDIPLGGWTGTVTAVEPQDEQVIYDIEWDRRTLDAMHPVYRKRCERDELDLETMSLGEDDLEPDDGTPVPIEQPTNIVTPPLSEKDQDDRVRKALGLTHDDPLPEISRETLVAYHRYLSAKLRFPFKAFTGEEELGPVSRKRSTMTVTRLLDPEQEASTTEDGLICAGRVRDEEAELPLYEIEVKKKDPNARLVSDYAYWFYTSPLRSDGDDEWDVLGPGDESLPTPPGRWDPVKTILACGVASGLMGAAIGAAFQTIRGATLAALLGGIPLSLIGALLLGRYGLTFGAVNWVRRGWLLGAAIGLGVGWLFGTLIGLVFVTLPWSLLGAIAGMLVGPYLVAKRRQPSRSLRGAVLGLCCGILLSAYRQDQSRAIAGGVSGLIAGAVVGAGFFPALIVAVSFLPRMKSRSGSPGQEPDALDDSDDD